MDSNRKRRNRDDAVFGVRGRKHRFTLGRRLSKRKVTSETTREQ
jgi:hypothetical protein